MFYHPSDVDRRKYAGMSVIIATPCKDNEMAAKFCKDVVNMVGYSWLHGLKVYQMGITERMVIHWARNDLAKQCNDHVCEYTGEKFTHILWLDDDQVFTPDLLVYLARHREAHDDLDVVSALYYGRTQHLPVAYVKDFNDDKYKHFPLIEVPRTLCEVDAVGFGGLLMRRDVLDRLEEPWFNFKRCGEDIYFCVHAKEQGIKIHLEGTFIMGHLGDAPVIHTPQYERYMKDNEEQFADRTKVGLGGVQHG